MWAPKVQFIWHIRRTIRNVLQIDVKQLVAKMKNALVILLGNNHMEVCVIRGKVVGPEGSDYDRI